MLKAQTLGFISPVCFPEDDKYYHVIKSCVLSGEDQTHSNGDMERDGTSGIKSWIHHQLCSYSSSKCLVTRLHKTSVHPLRESKDVRYGSIC